VCGPGEDTVLLGRNDEVVVGAVASELPDGDVEPREDESSEEAVDDGCEHVKYPKGGEPKGESCAANSSGCDEREPCAARVATYCHEPEPCAARVATEVTDCDDPPVVEPKPDEPVEEPEPETP
jgi:hypothetical protein